MEATEPQAGESLERTLARYARVRLEPSPAQARRARAAVMEAAWRSRIEADAASRRWRLPFAGWSARRVTLAAAAAMFAGVCLGSSAFAASRAGGPLYDARISFEQATLPADPSARMQAQIANAYTRLAEARDAEVQGDQGALVAALRAYAADATTLASATGSSAGLALAAVEQHRSVLLSLVSEAPYAALPGLNQALTSSDHAIERLTDASSNGSGPSSGNGGNGTGGNGSGNGAGENGSGGNGAGNGAGGYGAGGNGAGNGANGNGAASPASTDRPAATSKPGHPINPAATPKPQHTPKPGPSANPGSGAAQPSPPDGP